MREPALASRRDNRPAFLKQLHAPVTSLGPVSSASAISRDEMSEYTSRLTKPPVQSTDRAGQRSRLENLVRYLRFTRALSMNRKTTNNAATMRIAARERCSGRFQRISEIADPASFREIGRASCRERV